MASGSLAGSSAGVSVILEVLVAIFVDILFFFFFIPAGISCGEPGLPGVCTRVSKYKNWMQTYINS